MKKISMFIVVFVSIFISIQMFAQSTFYTRVTLKGSVNPITAAYITESIQMSQDEGAQFVLLTIDTPGGLMISLREIVQSILTSKIPVVVYTYPKGAQAASAGGFIMLSGHINAMAPGTEIGAMHPVAPGLTFYEEEQTEEKSENLPDEKNVMGMKVLNDTLAYGRSLAQEHNRNSEWVEKAISDALSSTYLEAQENGVVDYVADNIPDLLEQINGKTIVLNDKEFTFNTTGIDERKESLSASQSFLNFFADPQVLMLLLIVAIGGIALEVRNPGMILPGTLGAIATVLFLMTINIIPVSFIGITLIVTGMVLFVLEIFITSYGLLTLAGLAAYIGGSLMLFDNPIQGFSVSPVTIGSTVVLILLLVFVIMRAVLQTHKEATVTGDNALVGRTAVVKNKILPGAKGKVFLHGELWNAVSENELDEESEVVVTAVSGMTVTVKKPN
jgi:membrane-bound serine protease (ClpP class)